MKALDELVNQPGAWLEVGKSGAIIVSSRVRLARNIAGASFPGWAGDDESLRLQGELLRVCTRLQSCPDPLVFEMAALSRMEKEVLIERHLVSRDLTEKGRGSALVLKKDESISVMVNEEDHIRMQALSPGLNLHELWQRIDSVDNEIESSLEYAFSTQLGYLTSCPSNVGTGIRASVMMHLPGLVLMNEINQVIKAVNKMDLAVRGLWGEGTDAAGNMFQISNQSTLGETEQAIIGRLEKIVLEINDHEKNSRLRLLEQKENQVRDHLGRAIGILTHAHMLNSKETLDMLSALRLGIDLGLAPGWKQATIDELFLLIQPGHLQKLAGRAIGTEKRDLARARLIRLRLLGKDV